MLYTLNRVVERMPSQRCCTTTDDESNNDNVMMLKSLDLVRIDSFICVSREFGKGRDSCASQLHPRRRCSATWLELRTGPSCSCDLVRVVATVLCENSFLRNGGSVGFPEASEECFVWRARDSDGGHFLVAPLNLEKSQELTAT